MHDEIDRLKLDLKSAQKKSDPKWISLKLKLMKIQQQEKILAFKVKASKKRVNYSNLWLKEERSKDKIGKNIYTLLTFPVKKIRGFINWLDYPAIEIRSMFALERSQSVKDWLKYHAPENKLNNLKERRLSLTKNKDKHRKS